MKAKRNKKSKKGIYSLEVILVSAMLIGLTVGLMIAFSKTVGDSGTATNNAVADVILVN
jgi:hypothetical protein